MSMFAACDTDVEAELVPKIEKLGVESETWLTSFLIDDKIYRNTKPTIDEEFLKSPLIEREEEVKELKKLFATRENAYLRRVQGRENYVIPVIAGLPGLGKSRLLNEYQRFMPQKNDGIQVATFVVYNNGYSITEQDLTLDFISTFSFRLLHGVFQKGIVGSTPFDKAIQKLPELIKKHNGLTLYDACKVIRDGLEKNHELHPEQVLYLYVAVDEYQTIPNSDVNLYQLIEQFLNCSISLSTDKIYLFPIFSGVEWEKIKAFSSSNPFLKRVTPKFLSQIGSLKLASYYNPDALRSNIFVNCLSQIGDHPRTTVMFLKETSDSINSSEQIICSRSTVLRDYGVRSDEKITLSEMLYLISTAIIGAVVSPNDASSIKDLTWSQLANRGIILITDMDQILVSNGLLFSFFNVSRRDDEFAKPVERYLWESLRYILVHLPANLETETWLKWEYFGAHYHSIRINAFIITKRQTVSIRELFASCRVSPDIAEYTVSLRPAKVFSTDFQMSPQINLEALQEKNNQPFTVSAFDENTCYVFLNGACGEGVDCFYVLFRDGSKAKILVGDQRKIVSRIMSTQYCNELHQKVVSVAPPGIKTISVICSAITAYGKRKTDIPNSCILATRLELPKYHGLLHRNASTLTSVNINTIGSTWIGNNLNCDSNQAKLIRNKSKKAVYTTLSQFCADYKEITSRDLNASLYGLLMLENDLDSDTTSEGKDANEESDQDEEIII